MVSIGYAENEQWNHKCIGTILSKNTIITSAECVEKKGNLKLRTGDEDLNKSDDDQLAKTYDLGNVLVHPNRNINGIGTSYLYLGFALMKIQFQLFLQNMT